MQANKEFEEQIGKRMTTNNKASTQNHSSKKPSRESYRTTKKGCALAQQGPAAPWSQASGAMGDPSGQEPHQPGLPHRSQPGSRTGWGSGGARRVMDSLGQLTGNKDIERSYS